MIDRRSLERRLSILEGASSWSYLEGTLPDGEAKLFDVKRVFNLLFECMQKVVLEKKAPILADFSEDDQKYMKDFNRADLPNIGYIPMHRRCFAMTEMGDLSIKDLPLENFVGPVNLDALRIILDRQGDHER